VKRWDFRNNTLILYLAGSSRTESLKIGCPIRLTVVHEHTTPSLYLKLLPSMLFDCPHCGQTLKAADNTAGKKCRCTNCERLVVIPGAKPKPAVTSNQTTPPTKPVSVASELNDMIARQQEQRLQEAAEYYQQQERAQLRSTEHNRVRPKYSSQDSSSSAIRTILGFVLVIALVLGVVCCGMLGYFATGSSVQLKAGGYSITAKGHGSKKASSSVSARGEGILNRMTGSEFWLYVTTLPDNDPRITNAIMDRFGAEAVSSKAVQRGNLAGMRFSRVAAESLNMPDQVRCDMEVFVTGNEMVVAAYIPGASKAKAGIQRKSAFEGSQEFWDKPESFFESLGSATP
jgi:DNA-directed RNA polymerase subunit M/transcription elongation factor TFIIS